MLDDPGLIAEFVIESKEHLGEVEGNLLKMEQDGADVDSDAVNQVFRAVHSVKGAAGFLGLLRLQDLSHSMENVLNLIREKSLVPTGPIVELLLRSIDLLSHMLDNVEQSNDVDVTEYVQRLDTVADGGEAEAIPVASGPATFPEDDEVYGAPLGLGPVENLATARALEDKADDASDASPSPPDQTSPTAAAEVADAETTPPATDNGPPPEAGRKKRDGQESSIRVQVEVLDQLMNLAGELVLGRNQLLQAISSRDYGSLESVSTRLDQVTSELQDSIMQTRMQPIGSVFNKFLRVVRDVSQQLGKQCELELEGQDVEVDKSIGEAIGDPLTHLVRNSIGHGIENPAERVALGKPIAGRLQLRAYHQSGKVRIEICDDGKGIDSNRLREKAVAKGLMTSEAAAQLSENEAVRLIFHPGFSTAEQVTEVSGRGVGMDVVRSNIEKLGGSVEIKTSTGQGTTIVLTLPLTLAIIPSMVVGCGDQRFAIPQVNTAELVRIRGNEVEHRIECVKGAEVLRLRGALLPLVRLSETLELPVGNEPCSHGGGIRATERATNIVVVEAGSLRYGLIVDGMFDSEEIVVKPLGRHVSGCPCLSGATILGDGRVALILDVSGIANQAQLQNRQEENTQTDDVANESPSEELQAVLLFTNHSDERFAAPMHLVARIERIAANDINEIGGERVLHYRGGSLPLLSLEDHITARPRASSDRLFVIVFEASGHEIGLIASSLVDIRNVSADFDAMVSIEPGVAGTQVIDGAPTRAIDLHALAHAARPKWFKHAETANAHAVQQARMRPTEVTPSPTILLAEDSPFFRQQLVGFLTSEGYQVVECEDGQVAWQMLRAGQFDVSLILTDIEMPNMNGLELTRLVKGDDNLKHLPVIALTSLAGQEDEARGYTAGIDEYQVKLDRSNLLKSVHHFAPVHCGELAEVMA